ncbi:ABC-F family ATP-binding cassette domain-containing protein, partial [Arcticibacter svalbardensis]
VTHDRYFLDNVCNQIIELDKQRLFNYNGNYSYYLEKKSEREADDASSLQKNRNLLKKELEWMRRMPQARATKSKARIDSFYELEAKTKTSQNLKVELSTSVSRQGNKIIEIKGVQKGFNNKVFIEDFSYTFKKGDKIGIAGRNGTGKSTLLNLITGLIQPDAGTISIGETIVFGYYQQSGLELNKDERVIDVVKNVAEYIMMADGKTLTASQLLTHFLFPPAKQHNMVSKLSGGEKKRLQLMRVLMKNPNVLILDEPTNDLDIDTLNILEDFLERYSGVLLLVSHDRYLMDRLTNQLFILEGNSKVNIYSGNYTDYRLEKDNEVKTKESNKNTAPTSEGSKKNKLSYKEEKELEAIDVQVPDLENQIQLLTAQMNSGITDHQQLTALADGIQKLKNQLDLISVRWIELTEIQENQ